jgi:hypothetical protein
MLAVVVYLLTGCVPVHLHLPSQLHHSRWLCSHSDPRNTSQSFPSTSPQRSKYPPFSLLEKAYISSAPSWRTSFQAIPFQFIRLCSSTATKSNGNHRPAGSSKPCPSCCILSTLFCFIEQHTWAVSGSSLLLPSLISHLCKRLTPYP